MGERPGEGDVLVWCGNPAVLSIGSRVVLEAPGAVPGTWEVTVLDARGGPRTGRITVDIRDLVPEDMAE